MIIHKLSDMKGGWFVGNFDPTAWKTKDVEVCYKIHPKGDSWDAHYHKKAVEVNLLIKGKMKFQDQIISSGDIFTVFPWEVSNPEFLEECEVVIIKMPSVTGDKYVI